MRLSNREQSIFIICLATVFVYVVYVVFYKPLKEKVADLTAQTELAERQLEKHIRIIRKGKAYQPRFERYMAKYKQTTSDNEVMSSILSQIEQESGKFDIRISQLKPQRVKKENFYNNFSVSVTLEGALAEVIKLLYNLQHEPYLFKIEDARFDQHYQKPTNVQCQLILTKILLL